jgi:hypothetical protein
MIKVIKNITILLLLLTSNYVWGMDDERRREEGCGLPLGTAAALPESINDELYKTTRAYVH